MMITVQVRYFASLREALGDGESVSLVAQATVADLRDLLIARGSSHAQVLDRRRLVRCAVAQVMCSEQAVLSEGAEVAFFPPVTGG